MAPNMSVVELAVGVWQSGLRPVKKGRTRAASAGWMRSPCHGCDAGGAVRRGEGIRAARR